jgi:uncharacterized protein (DUF1684 family)
MREWQRQVCGRPGRTGRFACQAARSLGVVALLSGSSLAAQAPPALDAERAEYAHWLTSAALSPYAILALQPIGNGISIGYEPSDIPLPIRTRGIAREERGAITLTNGATSIALPRGRPVRLEQFTLVSSGAGDRAVIAAFGAVRNATPPTYYPFAPALSFAVALEPPERRGSFRTLALDGTESDATEAGFVRVSVGGATARLRVYRIGGAEDEEAELVVYFRDATNGKGSYPAGRYVTLIPESSGRVRLDFNRARNPFCAYSSVYPCPAPWPGNAIPAAIAAGEQYHSSGGTTP